MRLLAPAILLLAGAALTACAGAPPAGSPAAPAERPANAAPPRSAALPPPLLAEWPEDDQWQDLLAVGLVRWKSYGLPFYGPGPGWRAENGVLTLASDDEVSPDLATSEALGNFALRFEFRGQGGLVVRAQDGPRCAAATGAALALAPAAGAAAEAWRRAAVVARGPRVEFWLDGRRVQTVEAPPSGRIVLENGPGALEFRRVQLCPLPH